MKKYITQVMIYTKYFYKVTLENKLVFLYTALFPVVMIIIQSKRFFFQKISTTTFTRIVLPWIFWLIFTDILFAVMDIPMLREQGYLKQYSSLLSNNSVFIISKMIINLFIIFITLLCTSIFCAVLFRMNPFGLIFKLLEVLVLTYIPLVGICLPLICIKLKQKSIPVILNLATIALLVISSLIINTFTVKITDVLLNTFDPIYFLNDTFQFLIGNVPALDFFFTFAIVYIMSMLIGFVSYKKMLILPVEG